MKIAAHEGPQCPYCLTQYTAGEDFYYKESFTEMKCDNCDKTFKVEVFNDIDIFWICEEMGV